MASIKEFLKKIPFLLWIYHRISGREKHSVTYWIGKIAGDGDLDIVQIGSNDGCTQDPLHNLILERKMWRALFVEPVPYLFKKLRENYPREPRLRFENAAINNGSRLTFYWVDEKAKDKIPDLPDWYDQLGSFYRESITRHLNGVLEPFIVSSEVEGMTLSELLKKNDIRKVDILHIDTEGYDWNILSQIDPDHQSPLIILYEHKHLNQADKEKSLNHLRGKYHIFRFEGDFLCIRRYGANLSRKDLDFLTMKNPVKEP